MEKEKVRRENKIPDDRQILELFRKQSRKAVEETKEKYGDYCYAFVYRILGDEYDAEECVSNLYAHAWEEIPLQHPSDLKHYLTVTTRKLALEQYTGQNADRRLGETAQILDEFYECVPKKKETGASVPSAAVCDRFNSFLGSLDKNRRVVFMRRYWYLCPVKEIAEMMKLTVSDVRSLLGEMRGQFAERMSEQAGISGNKKNWLAAMSGIGGNYIDEADPEKTVWGWSIYWNKIRRKLLVSAAVLLCILGLASVVLLLPYHGKKQDVLRYSGSDYYPVIKKINTVTAKKPEYANRQEKLTAAVNGWLAKKKEQPEEEEIKPEETVTYFDLPSDDADSQKEADMIAKKDSYIYYLDGKSLKIYYVENDRIRQAGEHYFETGSTLYGLHLSPDGRSVTVILKTAESNMTQVRQYSVSNPQVIYEKNRFSVSGEYRSGRLENGNLLLVTYFSPGKKMNFGKETTYLPQTEDKNGRTSIPAEQILVPPHAKKTDYAVITLLDAGTLEQKGTMALLSAEDMFRLSGGHLYLVDCYDRKVKSKAFSSEWEDRTEIFCLEYDGGHVSNKGSVTVSGTLADRNSLDEYDGILRVCTTTNRQERKKVAAGSGKKAKTEIRDHNNTAFFCINTSNWKVTSKLENFTGEYGQIRSARFDKDRAYVSTFSKRENYQSKEEVWVKDDVWCFDLSIPFVIRIADTEHRRFPVGMAQPLTEFGGDYLLGIGIGSELTGEKLVLDLYRESSYEIVCSGSADKFTKQQILRNYCWIDREKQYIGIGTISSDQSVACSIYRFNGVAFTPVYMGGLGSNTDVWRSIFADGNLYLFGEDDVSVIRNGMRNWF